MFNRRNTQRVPAVVQQKNDIVSLNGIRAKNLEQRVLMTHENGIRSLNVKINELSSKIAESSKEVVVDVKNDPEILKLKEQCDIQSQLLSEYEKKVVNLVEYIKRLEQGLETVKELLTNKTNTADTMDAVPEFDEPAQENPETVSVEAVKEEGGEIKETVSLEIVDEETV
jgi:hypothetical protein